VEGRHAVATVGVFDGVHRGHQVLLAQVRGAADRSGAEAVAITFDPPPGEVLAPSPEPSQLTPRESKRALLALAGMDRVELVAFTLAFARLAPEEFIERTLLRLLDLEGLVVGYDFHFGAGGAGNTALLRASGRKRGFWVEEIAAVLDGGEPISSTRIRDQVRAGSVAEAGRLLGRPFTLDGRVAHGRGLGGHALVPTANLALDPHQLFPADGVYVAQVPFSGRLVDGVASVGTSPTLGPGGERLVEVHLIDFEGDLYDRELSLQLLDRIREQIRFEGLTELAAAIRGDIQRAREWRARHGENRLAAP
jgi:riboflavin kinase/FMN adenylyltransferase